MQECHRLEAKDARAGPKILPDPRRVEIFGDWRSKPLSAYATIPVPLLLCFGVFDQLKRYNVFRYFLVFLWGEHDAGHTAE